MTITFSGSMDEVLEQVTAYAERHKSRAIIAGVNEPKPAPIESSVGPALAEMVRELTGDNKKVVDFLLEKGKEQNADSIAARLAIQVIQLNGPLGAINARASRLTGRPLIMKKKRGRKMYYWINPLVERYL
jgi:hypothetical protein